MGELHGFACVDVCVKGSGLKVDRPVPLLPGTSSSIYVQREQRFGGTRSCGCTAAAHIFFFQCCDVDFGSLGSMLKRRHLVI
jgi:hypothetical protein